MAPYAEPEAARRPELEEERAIESLLSEESAHGCRSTDALTAMKATST